MRALLNIKRLKNFLLTRSNYQKGDSFSHTRKVAKHFSSGFNMSKQVKMSGQHGDFSFSMQPLTQREKDYYLFLKNKHRNKDDVLSREEETLSSIRCANRTVRKRGTNCEIDSS